VTQELLAHALQVRLDACTRLGGGADNRADVQVVVVVKSLDVGEVARVVRDAAASASAGVVAEWAVNFTKCVLLAGTPSKVVPRFASLRWTLGDGVAVAGPAPAKSLMGLRRLLRPLHASPPPERLRGTLPPLEAGSNAVLDLSIAYRGLSLEQYLVALVHSVAEAHLRELLPKGAELHVCPVDVLHEVNERDLYLRVHRALPPEAGLRLYSALRLRTNS